MIVVYYLTQGGKKTFQKEFVRRSCGMRDYWKKNELVGEEKERDWRGEITLSLYEVSRGMREKPSGVGESIENHGRDGLLRVWRVDFRSISVGW